MHLQNHHRADSHTDETLPAVFERLGKSLRRMAQTLVGNADDAEDALQEAFCRLWTRRKCIQTEDEAAKLLTTTVKHLSIDVLRRRKTIGTLSIDEERDTLEDDETDYQESREEQFNRVKALINSKLTPLQQEILHRREVLGEDYELISKDLQMQQTAIRAQLSRARKTIRECYKNQEL